MAYYNDAYTRHPGSMVKTSHDIAASMLNVNEVIDNMMTSSNGNIFRELDLCEGNPQVTSGFLLQCSVTRSFDAFFDLRLNKRLSKQSRRRWFETTSHLLWRHYNDTFAYGISHQWSVDILICLQQHWMAHDAGIFASHSIHYIRYLIKKSRQILESRRFLSMLFFFIFVEMCYVSRQHCYWTRLLNFKSDAGIWWRISQLRYFAPHGL